MQTNGNIIRNQIALSPTHVWDTAKGWAKEYMTKERMFDAALTLTTVGSAGFVLLTLRNCVMHWTLTGF